MTGYADVTDEKRRQKQKETYPCPLLLSLTGELLTAADRVHTGKSQKVDHAKTFRCSVARLTACGSIYMLYPNAGRTIG